MLTMANECSVWPRAMLEVTRADAAAVAYMLIRRCQLETVDVLV